jgi:murein DD-endopeptidase MepM/ murein hydrolase activator NlpD
MEPRGSQGREAAIQGTVTPPSGPRRRSRRLLRAHRDTQASRHRHARPIAQFGVILSLLGVIVLFGHFPALAAPNAGPRLLRRRPSLPGLAAEASAAVAPAEIQASPLPLTVVSPPTVQDQLLAASNQTASAVEALQQSEQQGSSTANVDGGTVTAARSTRVPIFFEYVVQPGDTLTGLAERFGIGSDFIVWNNSEVTDRNLLPVGVTLQIPSIEGIIHSVRKGESVSSIAALYGADPQDIVQFEANGLANDPNKLQPNQLIMVPGGHILPPKAVPADTVPPASSVGSDGWAWPAVGPLTSTYGPWHPLGIDIGIPTGTPILAARAGTVVFAGGNPCCSYGYHIILDNGDGYETIYGHLSDFRSQLGDHVAQGQLIGISGSTGHSTGPHLHFEIRRDGVIQNPELFLPVDPWLGPGTAWPPPPSLSTYP